MKLLWHGIDSLYLVVLQDAECLLREFPELKCFEVPDGQLNLFEQEID